MRIGLEHALLMLAGSARDDRQKALNYEQPWPGPRFFDDGQSTLEMTVIEELRSYVLRPCLNLSSFL